MEIVRKFIGEKSLQQFADEHRFVMFVIERRNPMTPDRRFYAHFENVEVSERNGLVSVSGDGATEQAAMEDYAEKLSKRHIVYKAYVQEERKDISVPVLYFDETIK